MLELSIEKELKDISNPEWKIIIIDGIKSPYSISNTGFVINDKF